MTPPLMTRLSPELVKATLAELQKPRTDLHRSHKVTWCDMGLSMPGLRVGRAVHGPGLTVTGDCVCRDLVLDVLHLVTVFLTEHGDDRTNLVGAVRSHVRKRVIDVFRGYRACQGAQVKPKQVRRNRFGRALPDEEHRAVLGHLADEAGYTAPLPGQGYLLRRLAERCADEFGKTVNHYLERMPSIVHTVKDVCSAGNQVNVGTRTAPEYVSWYEAYIERPLGRRPENISQPLSDETPWQPAADSDSVIVELIVSSVAAAPPDDQLPSLSAAVRALAAEELISRDQAESLLADQVRLGDVLASVREVANA